MKFSAKKVFLHLAVLALLTFFPGRGDATCVCWCWSLPGGGCSFECQFDCDIQNGCTGCGLACCNACARMKNGC
jgi:hypothetical protein